MKVVREELEGSCCKDMLQRSAVATKKKKNCVMHTEATCSRDLSQGHVFEHLLSKCLDGAICLPCGCCVMECDKNGAKLDKLFRSPLTFWTTARGRFDSHAK